jgi:hypothetical protein
MRAVSEFNRKRLLCVAAALCATSLALAPLAGRSSFELTRERALYAERISSPQPPASPKRAAISRVRDPFVADAAPIAQGGMPLGGAVVNPVSGMRVVQGASTGFPLGAPIVRAIVSGDSPRALVEDGGRVRVVGVGDVLAGSPVVSIDRQGIRLGNGVRLGFAGNRP